MKNLVLILIVIFILTFNACFAQEAKAPGERLAFKVLRGLSANGKNALVSPYSLYTALSMAAEGARGETLEQLLTALETDKPADIKISAAETANAAFIADGAGVTDAYTQKLSAYGARLFGLDSGDISEINLWAKQVTNGIIDPLLTRPLDENTKLVMINAITMKAEWLTPFKPNKTSDRVFHATSGDVKTPFMSETIDMLFAKRDSLTLGVLPYADDGLEAYFILPELGGMDSALEKLCDEGYGIFDGLEKGLVRVFVPKLDLAADMSLSKALIESGVKDAFTYDADLSGINERKDLMIDDVAQKAALKLDEKGTEAAAGTSVTVVPKGIMPAPESAELFRLDRPFILLIRDGASGQTLFAARVENPTER